MLPGGHIVVVLSGELDITTASAMRDALADAARRAVTGVIVDLAEVTFLNAAGLGVLVGAHSRARHLPDGLRLAAVPPHALRLLKLTGLDRHLAAYPAPHIRRPERPVSRRSEPGTDGPPRSSGYAVA